MNLRLWWKDQASRLPPFITVWLMILGGMLLVVITVALGLVWPLAMLLGLWSWWLFPVWLVVFSLFLTVVAAIAGDVG